MALTQQVIDRNLDRKRYLFVDCQANLKARDDHYSFPRDRFSLLQKQLMAMGVVAACAFLLAFELGLIDYLRFLFQ